VLVHMQHLCCRVVVETAQERETRHRVAEAAPAVRRRRREQADKISQGTKMPILVANSSLVGWLSVCGDAASMQPECLLLATGKGTGTLLQSEANSSSWPHPLQADPR